MAHKLSLISNQTANHCFWNQYDSNPYNDEKITKITDNIGEIEVPVTSIPSPFARIHLFETAFNYVVEDYLNNPKSLDGKTTYHRLISDCLDVYEILFSFDELRLSNKIKLVTWDFSKLKAMQESPNQGRRILADVLALYINNYNKDKRFVRNNIQNPFNIISVLLLENEVIAGTSPFTGFFTTSNKINKEIKNHDGRVFFSNILPLYKRNIKFQKFINLFFEAQPNVIHSFPAVHKYLEINRTNVSDSQLKKYLDEIKIGDHLTDLGENKILYINGNALYVLPGIPYRYVNIPLITMVSEVKGSDYIINTRKHLSTPPIAVKNKLNNPHWNYFRGKPFDSKIVIPAVDKRNYDERTVPGFDEIKYPYIIRNDFLSKYIIELDYDINDNKFWVGNNGKMVSNILLPIKPDYFKFFTIEDLKQNLSITKLNNSGAIVVELQIPIRADNNKAKITFKRTFNKINPNNLEDEDKGAIIPAAFYMGIYPFFKLKNNLYNDYYKIAIFNDETSKIDCSFFREDVASNKIFTVPINNTFVRTREAEGLGVVSKYIEISKEIEDNEDDIRFDFISINTSVNDILIEGLIIPQMPVINSLSDTASGIAYDIGTSNTFVAVSATGDVEKLSNFTKDLASEGAHFVMLHKPVTDMEDIKGSDQLDINSRLDLRFRPLQLNEFMPSIIGGRSQYSFPIPTIINQDNDCDAANENSIRVLSSVNIPFAFGNEKLRNGFDNAFSNLKWGISNISNTAARNRLKAFIEQLVLMGRNKILSEGKNPANTDVMWFKPLSMASGQIATFNNIWDEYFKKYFSKNENNTKKLHNITESWAPFYSYEKTFGAGRFFVNIDIGGGTTDILAFKDNKPTLTCSFRFAGNHLFDNGINFDDKDAKIGKPKDNGFVLKYEKIMKKIFEDNEDEDKLDILDYIYKSTKLNSEDLIGFFFGIKEFSEFLKLDKNFMLLFLLHNTAVFYHAAQILKANNPNEIPAYIGLSGNGSRLLEIPNKNNNLNRAKGMANMVNLIFKFVFELEEIPNIKLQILSNPKQSTAIGGLKGLKQILDNPTGDIDNYYIPLGDKDTIIHFNDYETKKKFSYENIRNENKVKTKIADNYSGFISYFFERLWFEADMPNNFGVDKSYNTKKLETYFNNPDNIANVLDSTINYKMMVEKELELNETLFFVPLRAYLYDFSKIIADESELNKFKGI